MDQDKRRYRQLKRDIKKAGNRKRRQHLKRQLHDNPEEAAHPDFDFGRDSSASLNGNDNDATRRRAGQDEEDGPGEGSGMAVARKQRESPSQGATMFSNLGPTVELFTVADHLVIHVPAGKGEGLRQYLESHGIQAAVSGAAEAPFDRLELPGDVNAVEVQALLGRWEK